MIALRLGVCAKALEVQGLVPLQPDGLDRSGVHPLLIDDAVGELHHRDGLRKSSFVEPIDRRLDHLEEALRDLAGILRLDDDPVHGIDGAALGRRLGTHLLGAFRLGGRRRLGTDPSRQDAGERAEDVRRFDLQADLAQPFQVLLELLRISRAARRGGEELAESDGRSLRLRDAEVRDLPSEPVEEKRKAPHAPHVFGREGGAAGAPAAAAGIPDCPRINASTEAVSAPVLSAIRSRFFRRPSRSPSGQKPSTRPFNSSRYFSKGPIGTSRNSPIRKIFLTA